ncbi:hypothetical protein WJX72_003744 [[Myrmecia] bisecta]|uniref:Pre-mRNA-splicing factor 38 n=1 Tax=[Myrmecia] bisecta TaxID=41462 RepID=A0AAW1QES5_9CHLO
MEQYGNQSTFNVESVLRKNITDGEYYRDTCLKLGTWEEVVDEIYYNVTHVEPWMSGNARGASTAFCLLYRLFNLKLTEKQVQDLLEHPDSPYIRAVGFLYLRYVGNPKTLWDWISPYIRDKEEITPSGENGKSVAMGAYVRDVFLEQYYFETIFPRIPKPVGDDFVRKLQGMGLPTKAVGNGGQGGGDRRGVDEPNRRPASVKASLSVAFGQRAPNRSTAREEGRGLGAGMKGLTGAGSAAARSPPRGDRPRSESRDGRNGNREPDRRPDRDADSARDRKRDDDVARDRDRERERSKASRDHRGPSRDQDSHRPREADRERSRHRDSSRDHRKRSRSMERPRGSSRDVRRRSRSAERPRASSRDVRKRSRSPARHRDGNDSRDRSTRDVFREAPEPAVGSKVHALKERYG